MKEILIKSATKKDKSELLKFFEHYRNKSLVKNRVECYLSHNHTVIACDNKKIIGIAQWYIKENPKSGVVEIEEVFVLDEYRGQGVGLKIIEFTINSIKNNFNKIGFKLRKIYLFVSKNNYPAINLYQSIGFKEINQIGNLFDDLETELFYCLNLN